MSRGLPKSPESVFLIVTCAHLQALRKSNISFFWEKIFTAADLLVTPPLPSFNQLCFLLFFCYFPFFFFFSFLLCHHKIKWVGQFWDYRLLCAEQYHQGRLQIEKKKPFLKKIDKKIKLCGQKRGTWTFF
jgi:hypothetical protein